MLPEIALAHQLMAPHLPEGTTLEIKTYEANCSYKVVMHLTYTSKRSGRQMAVVAKGDTLPTTDDGVVLFYVRQLVMSQIDVTKEFSRLYFLERRAKQEAWLALGKTSRKADGSGDTISIVTDKLDALKASQYSPAAAADEVLHG